MKFIVRAQPGFHVSDRHARVKCHPGCGERCSRIALNHQPIRLNLVDHTGELGKDASGDIERRLIGPHDIEIEFGTNGKRFQHLIEHVAVLAGGANDCFEAAPLDRANHWSQLDDLGACAENRQDAHSTASGISALSMTPAMRSASACQSNASITVSHSRFH